MGKTINQTIKKERNSNLELFRIIAMLLIVAHHYVVNSGLLQIMQSTEITGNSIFLYLLGMWGKIGINCFVLITGYFMCKSNITVSKFLKLILEIWFYNIIIYSLFIVFNIIDFEFESFVRMIIPIGHVGLDFTTAFLCFYLFIPFLNILVNAMNKKQHIALIALFLAIYSIWPMIPGFGTTYNYVTWFIVLYFIASYLRIYPNTKYSNNTKFWAWMTAISITISMISVVIFRFIQCKYIHPYFLVSDSTAIFAIIVAVSSFMLFKNIKMKQNKFINTIAASTFGVLLIHANSNAMRQFLWVDVLKNCTYFNHPYLWIHALASVIGVFIICIIIDRLRIMLIERPLFNSSWFINLTAKIQKYFDSILN